jgi:hypothetical protein
MKNQSKSINLPTNKKSIVFLTLFFAFNLFQQHGRREDYPFTYFGMYKEGRLETKSFYQFKIFYQGNSNAKELIDIASFEMDHYYLKKKLDALLLNQTYLPNNDTLTPSENMSEDQKEEKQALLDKLFIKDIIPQLRKKNLALEKAYLQLQIKYWDDLSPDNSKQPTKVSLYHKKSISSLLLMEDKK